MMKEEQALMATEIEHVRRQGDNDDDADQFGSIHDTVIATREL